MPTPADSTARTYTCMTQQEFLQTYHNLLPGQSLTYFIGDLVGAMFWCLDDKRPREVARLARQMYEQNGDFLTQKRIARGKYAYRLVKAHKPPEPITEALQQRLEQVDGQQSKP